MEVTFTSERGLCPYFIYKNIKYYIQDEKTSNGVYVFCLYSKDLRKEVRTFKSNEDALAYVKNKNNVRKLGTYDTRTMYSTTLNNYILEGKNVEILQSDRPLSQDFGNYIDCLNFAKKRITELITAEEPEQVALF